MTVELWMVRIGVGRGYTAGLSLRTHGEARAIARIFAQQDGQPSEATRPISWWQPGWYFRDVYYLSIPAGTAAGEASLDLVLYDSYSQEIVRFAGEKDALQLLPVRIGE